MPTSSRSGPRPAAVRGAKRGSRGGQRTARSYSCSLPQTSTPVSGLKPLQSSHHLQANVHKCAHGCRPASACDTSGDGAVTPVSRGPPRCTGWEPSPRLTFRQASACGPAPEPYTEVSPRPQPRGLRPRALPCLSSRGLRKHRKDGGQGLLGSQGFTFCRSLQGCFLCALNRCAVLSFKFDTFLFLNLKKAQWKASKQDT